MPSALPTEDSLSKTLDTYGLGAYDGMRDEDAGGEDDETGVGPALPGIPDLPIFEPYIGYPQSETPQGKHAFSDILSSSPALRKHICRIDATSILPNDANITPRIPSPESDIKGGVLAPTDVTNVVSHTELPVDGNNPAARADYYDDMQTGGAEITLNSIGDIWPDEDTGSYAGVDSLPTPTPNNSITENYTNPLGNSDSGFVVEDQNVPRGFPSTEFKENVDFPHSNDGSTPGGRLLATGRDHMNRVATDIPFVEELTSKFLKEHGKKNITRRAVTSFLQTEGHGDKQYIASDIVRCLKHSHNIIVPDALDIFPVKTASTSSNGLIGVYRTLLSMEIEYLDSPEVSRELGTCASTIARTIDILNRKSI